MAANDSVWRFTQLEGKKRVLLLADHAAPHGRPRNKPILEPEIEIREDSTYFAGSGPPTRHLFGLSHHSFKLEGRFSDAYGGKGFAREKLQEVKSFVSDITECHIEWDDLLSVIGLIKRFKPGIESGGEVTWELEILVDVDLLLEDTPQLQQGPSVAPIDMSNAIEGAFLDGLKGLRSVPTMRGSIFDAIGSLISAVNSATASVARIAAQIDSLATAPFQLLRRLRDGLGQFRTAVTNLRTTYDNLTVNLALMSQADADNNQRFWDIQAAWGDSSLKAMALALKADRAVAVVEQGQILALYTANDGDTWELVSRKFYGGASDRAADIRAANGIEAGQNPVAGTVYMVPR